jgi:outer membrane lipoprotein SlyB
MRALLSVLALLLAGCAGGPRDGGSDTVSTVRLGVIESVTPVEMDASSRDDASLGGTLGQVGGASAGGGRGAAAGAILGSVLGATLGHQAGIATRPGLEIWVRLDGEEDRSAYVMQPGLPGTFSVGDRVRVVRKKGITRVEPEIAPATFPEEPGYAPQQPAQ